MPCPPARARLAASCSRSAADPAVIAVIAVIVVIVVITDPAVIAVICLSVRRLVQHCGQMTAGGGATRSVRGKQQERHGVG